MAQNHVLAHFVATLGSSTASGSSMHMIFFGGFESPLATLLIFEVKMMCTLAPVMECKSKNPFWASGANISAAIMAAAQNFMKCAKVF